MTNKVKDGSIIVIHGLKFVRDSISEALNSSSNLTVSHSFSRPSDALGVLHSNPPDVVLLDVSTFSGEDHIELVQAGNSSIAVVVWGIQLKEKDVIRYASFGVAGYVTSEDTTSQIVRAINGVLNREISNPRIAWILNQYIHNSSRVPQNSASISMFYKPAEGSASKNGEISLTTRELEVVKLIDKGMSNKEIARTLNVELSTIKNHVHSILGKFRVNRRMMAAARYRSLSDKVVHI